MAPLKNKLLKFCSYEKKQFCRRRFPDVCSIQRRPNRPDRGQLRRRRPVFSIGSRGIGGSLQK